MYDNEREFYHNSIGDDPVGETDSLGSAATDSSLKDAEMQSSAVTQSAGTTQGYTGYTGIRDQQEKTDSTMTVQNNSATRSTQISEGWSMQGGQTAQAAQTVQEARSTQYGQTAQAARTVQEARSTQYGQTAQAAQPGRTISDGAAAQRYAGYGGQAGYTDASSARRETRSAKPKKAGFFKKALVSLSLGLLFGIFAGAGFLGVTQATQVLQKSVPAATEKGALLESSVAEKEEEDAETLVQKAEPEVIYADTSGSVSEIVKEVMPAMVSITNNYTEVTTFWGQTYSEELSASGSGIIVAQNDEELLIVTNQHVVAEADSLKVTLDDGTEVEAKLKGADKDMDLAVIAINVDDLTQETLRAISVASLGDSDSLELGEQVIAIGNALGYGQSVTVGYVSALDREIKIEDGSVRSFIQTDAAINPGNSGGALLNSKGQVIGINSNKIGGSSIEGMGYAIPITAASPIIADLMERQTRNKVADGATGYMGISYQDVTDQIAQMYGMPKGVYVVSVQEGSGAETAGVMKGDVITRFDGDRIESFEDLQNVLQYFAPGDTVKLVVQRPVKGEYMEVELELTLGERPSNR